MISDCDTSTIKAGVVTFIAGHPGRCQGPVPCELPVKLVLHDADPDVDVRGSRHTDGRRYKLCLASGQKLVVDVSHLFQFLACKPRDLKTVRN